MTGPRRGWQPEGGAAAPAPAYPDVITWFSECLSPLIRRRMGGGRGWCAQWWSHPEALARLTAAWSCWEVARIEGGPAMSAWFIHTMDPHLDRLMDVERGPFQRCSDRGHDGESLKPLPHTPPPSAWVSTWQAFMAEPDGDARAIELEEDDFGS